VASRRRSGDLDGDDAALSPWDGLAEQLKESNRAQASHLGIKLGEIGYALAPLAAWSTTDAVFTPEEVELLARLEHDRYVAERISAGWRAGATRDPDARTSPHLVSWDALPPALQEQNREAVRAIPAILSRSGYQLVRRARP
jgi:hypothetical protein